MNCLWLGLYPAPGVSDGRPPRWNRKQAMSRCQEPNFHDANPNNDCHVTKRTKTKHLIRARNKFPLHTNKRHILYSHNVRLSVRLLV